MKYLILLFLTVSIGIPGTANALDYAACKTLRTRIEFHLSYAETAGIDVNISIAESLKAISYLLLYQIHGCQNTTGERPFILPPVSFEYSRPKIRFPNLEIKPGPFGHGKSYIIRQNPHQK